MVSCAVSGCRNYNDKMSKIYTTHKALSEAEDVTFFPFPKNEVLRQIWLSRCGRKDNDVNIKKMRICSKHFKADDYAHDLRHAIRVRSYLKKDAIPTQNLTAKSYPISESICVDLKNFSRQQLTMKLLSSHELGLNVNPSKSTPCIKHLSTKGNNTAEFNHWMDACKDSAEHIRRLRNPLICPLHFNPEVMTSAKLYPTDPPIRYLTAEDIKALKQEMASINQLVAEWMILTQRNNPELVINGNLLKSKAKEVATVLKMNHFDADLGWLHAFELYINLNGIKHWRKRANYLSKSVNEKVNKDSDEKLVEENDKSSVELDSERSIQTYREALEKLKLLEDYVKRTQNNNAIELVTHMQKILSSILE